MAIKQLWCVTNNSKAPLQWKPKTQRKIWNYNFLHLVWEGFSVKSFWMCTLLSPNVKFPFISLRRDVWRKTLYIADVIYGRRVAELKLKRPVKAYQKRYTMHLIIFVANKRQTQREKGRFIDGKLIKLSVISEATHPCRTISIWWADDRDVCRRKWRSASF